MEQHGLLCLARTVWNECKEKSVAPPTMKNYNHTGEVNQSKRSRHKEKGKMQPQKNYREDY